MIYIVTAHRWGWLNADMYHVWAGADRGKAERIAKAEVIDRGDKYGCQVLECSESPDGMQFRRVAYFCSTYGEKMPYYSPYIAMHQELGQLVRDAVLDGNIITPKPDSPRYATFARVEAPQWLADEVNRRMPIAKAADEIGRNGQQPEDS
jgi:hypothetical protein